MKTRLGKTKASKVVAAMRNNGGNNSDKVSKATRLDTKLTQMLRQGK